MNMEFLILKTNSYAFIIVYHFVSPEYGSAMVPKSQCAVCTKPLQSEIRRLQSDRLGRAPPQIYNLLLK